VIVGVGVDVLAFERELSPLGQVVLPQGGRPVAVNLADSRAMPVGSET
jgi:hypothetical protein